MVRRCAWTYLSTAADPQVALNKKAEETPQDNIMSKNVHDVRNMKFEQRRQDTIDKWMQDMSIEKVERKILKEYSGVIDGWTKVLSDKFEMQMSLNNNALCAIVCTLRGATNSSIEYQAIVTWPRDNREEVWQLEYFRNTTSIYGFDFMRVKSPAVAATHVTPDDDRYILATYFPKMQACKDILSIYFRDKDFSIDCRWAGDKLCTLRCRKQDIYYPQRGAHSGATVGEDNHILATHKNLTVYNLVVQWTRHQPDESWTLKVTQNGHQPKQVHEFRYNGPNSPVTDGKRDGSGLKNRGCRIAGLLQRLDEMTTI